MQVTKRRVLVGIGVVLIALLAVVGWQWRARGVRAEQNAPGEIASGGVPRASAGALGGGNDGLGAPDAGVRARASVPVDRAVADRALRDDLRRRIFTTWSASQARPAPAGRPDPLYAPMPTLDGGAIDPDYIRDVVHQEFLSMASGCHEQYMARTPGPHARGRVVMEFTIVGDEHVGGIVDAASFITEGDGGGAGFGDAEFATCMRGSMLSLAFRPPAGRGRVTVHFPITLSADQPPLDAGD